MNLTVLLQGLVEVWGNDESVHAAWVEGSHAEGTADNRSDYDVWVDVEDGHEQAVVNDIESFFNSKGELDLNFELNIAHPHLRHITYHLKGMDKFHRIEINIQSHSRNYVFKKDVDIIKVLFDKDHTIQYEDYSEKADLGNRKKFLSSKFNLGWVWVEKEIERNNYIEAFAAYEYWIIKTVVELARIMHCPQKRLYDLKHIKRDLPQNIVTSIEGMYRNKTLDDIKANMKVARVLLDELLSQEVKP